jgi:hypothetical protein
MPDAVGIGGCGVVFGTAPVPSAMSGRPQKLLRGHLVPGEGWCLPDGPLTSYVSGLAQPAPPPLEAGSRYLLWRLWSSTWLLGGL